MSTFNGNAHARQRYKTWVLTNHPDKKKHRRKTTCKAKCRDCHQMATVKKSDFKRAASPRCIACGGMLDKMRS